MANTVLGKVSCVPRGNYSASATYYALDIVGYQGGSYLAMQEVTGVTPSNDQTNWMQLSGPGLPGEDGTDGATFIPSVSEAGVISWTNDGGLGNPNSVNIMGPQGDSAGFGTVTATADNTSSTSPSVDVQSSGPDTAKNFTFAFSGLKGNPGETPDIEIGTVTTLEPDQDATATISGTTPNLTLSLGIPKGTPGDDVDHIIRTEGTGAAGTTDTYTMYSSDGSVIGTFTVYNGSNGTGSGDFMANGTVPMTGALNMGGNKVTGMAEPTVDTDGATKGYVDEAISDVTITTDATPTQGSTNPVQSGGVYTALQEKLDAPDGGTSGQVLTKTESGEAWQDAPDGLPEGGETGQVLTKTSTGAQWDDVPSDLPAGGTDGQILTKTADGVAWEDAPEAGVTSFKERTGAVTPQEGDYTADMVGARPATWTPTASDVGAIPATEKGAASGVATLGTDGKLTAAQKPAYTASEVGARPSTWTPSAADVGAVPTSRTVNNKALSADISLTASDVGARPSSWTPTASEVGAVPTSRTVNGKPLSSNISLTADDVGAANPPALRTATLSASRWSGNRQTVTVQGVETSGQSVRISPATKTDADNWVAAGVWCSKPTTANRLVFTCDTAPTENININVELQEVQS